MTRSRQRRQVHSSGVLSAKCFVGETSSYLCLVLRWLKTKVASQSMETNSSFVIQVASCDKNQPQNG